MPGPESLDDPRSRAGVGAGAVAAAVAAVALPSAPCLSSLRTVLGEIRDCPDPDTDPPVEAVPDPPEADPEPVPEPPDPDPPVGLFPPTPGMLS